jgi:hypothetical protein
MAVRKKVTSKRIVTNPATGNRLTRVKGKWLRVLDMPNPLHEPPGRHGMQWDHMGEGLERNAPYDVESMVVVRKLGGVKGLARRMMPHLSPDRVEKVVDRVEAACHRKQRMAGSYVPYQGQGKPLLIPVFNARRLSKREKRNLRKERQRDSVKQLKALLAEIKRNK